MTVSEPREHKKGKKEKPTEDAVDETAKPKKSKKRKAEDVEGAIEDASTEVKEEKKIRKEAVEEERVVEWDGKDKSEKKKKRKHKEKGLIVTSVDKDAQDGSQPEGLQPNGEAQETPASGGKKRKRERSALEEHEQHVPEKKSKKSKDKKTCSEEQEGSNAEDKKKKKKRSAASETADHPDKAAKKEKKSKKRRSLTDLPNPESDESLSDQARKALSYAFSQFSDPPSWKFNKARQNWLLRNIWSDKAIPDTYLPLSIRYLANVQGGVRENLIKMSRTHLDAAPPSEEVQVETKTAEAKAASDGAKPDTDVADATDAPGASPVDAGIARLRAQTILDALGAN